MVNAVFGTATAMGAALVPATAIMINGVEFQFNLPLYGTVYFTGMKGPGFIMCGLWIFFTLVLVCTFEEPEQSGLEEQKRKEAADLEASANSDPSSMEMNNLDISGELQRIGNSSSSGMGCDFGVLGAILRKSFALHLKNCSADAVSSSGLKSELEYCKKYHECYAHYNEYRQLNIGCGDKVFYASVSTPSDLEPPP